MSTITEPRPDTKALREQVFEAIAAVPGRGLTDEEIQDQLNLPGNTQRPRRGELVTLGRIRKAGSRLTKARHMAAVWVANENPIIPTVKATAPKAVTVCQKRGTQPIRTFKSFVVTQGRVQTLSFPWTLSILAGDVVIFE